MARRTHPARMTRVEIVSATRGQAVEVAIRSLGSGRVLFVRAGDGEAGAAAAMLEAERRCVERGYVLVMAPSATRSIALAVRTAA